MSANEKNPPNKMPAIILALIGGILMTIALSMSGFNNPADCGNINTPDFRGFIPLVPGIMAAAFAMRLWMSAAWIVLGVISLGIAAFITLQIQYWDSYAGTIAGCVF